MSESGSESEDGPRNNRGTIQRGDRGMTAEQDGIAQMRLAGMGNAQTINDLERMMVKKTVSKSTVLYCPFVNNAKELSYNQPFAKITLGFLGKNELSDTEKSEFWEEHKQMAHKALNVKRSNISGQMRKKFVGKWGRRVTH